MILRKIINFIKPQKLKTDLLYKILIGKIDLKKIKYLKVSGGINVFDHPTDAYRLINAIGDKYEDIKRIKYGYWGYGTIIYNDIKIINGQCTIGARYN